MRQTSWSHSTASSARGPFALALALAPALATDVGSALSVAAAAASSASGALFFLHAVASDSVAPSVNMHIDQRQATLLGIGLPVTERHEVVPGTDGECLSSHELRKDGAVRPRLVFGLVVALDVLRREHHPLGRAE